MKYIVRPPVPIDFRFAPLGTRNSKGFEQFPGTRKSLENWRRNPDARCSDLPAFVT